MKWLEENNAYYYYMLFTPWILLIAGHFYFESLQ